MIRISHNYHSILNKIKEELSNHKFKNIEKSVLEHIVKFLESNEIKENIYISTELPENFIKFKTSSLLQNFKTPNHDFFIEFDTFYHNYDEKKPVLYNIPSAFLKISANNKKLNILSKILNTKIDKDLVIPFYFIENEWKIPLFALNYDYHKANLVPLFLMKKQQMEISNDLKTQEENKKYYIHYILENYKKIVLINFNKNIDHIHYPYEEIDYLVPHIFMKEEKQLSEEDWMSYYKFDKEKIFKLQFIINYGLIL